MIVATDNTEHTEIRFSKLCALCGKFFVVSGFGQSKSEVWIRVLYNVEEQMEVFQLYQEEVEETFCLSNYNFRPS